VTPKQAFRLVAHALPIALKNPRSKKHVSIILKKNEIVSTGVNRTKTHPLAKRYGYYFDEVHSELDALLRYKGMKDGLTLVNFRFNRFGEMRKSRPCRLCVPWCISVFDHIYYTTNEELKRLK